MADSNKDALTALSIVTAINKLSLKSFSAKTRNELIFLILNDTVLVTRYDRAVLWDFSHKTPKLLGVSGQSSISATTDMAKKWRRLIQNIKDPKTAQILSEESFEKEKELWKEYTSSTTAPAIAWIPIFSHEKLSLGLWLERWEKVKWNNQELDILKFLTQSYGLAWEKFTRSYSLKKVGKNFLWYTLPLLLLLSFLIRVPLRIVAPCEVVPKDPLLVTAPLEDIIERVLVKPGQLVHVNDVLVEYDKRVALQNLKVAQEQVRVAQQDLNRAKTLAFKEERSLAEIAVLTAKLKKEMANLELAKYKVSQLMIKAPEEGTVMMENPDEWRGKPVKVGEKIMMLINPQQTKLRLWIPENDRIDLNPNQVIKVYLNVTPLTNRAARLNFISNATTLTEKHIVSFMAEADWLQPQTDVQPGLKGTAVLYGEKVSLFYWVMRKPWASFREFTGW